MILETPKDDEQADAANLRLLRTLRSKIFALERKR